MTLTIADRLALADLVHLYAAAVDDRRFDDVVELFTDTAELRLPDPPRSLEPVRHSRGRDGVRAAMAALAGVARTEHAIVGEVYAPGRTPTTRWAASPASRTIGASATTRSPTWSGICAMTTNICARGPAGASTAAR